MCSLIDSYKCPSDLLYSSKVEAMSYFDFRKEDKKLRSIKRRGNLHQKCERNINAGFGHFVEWHLTHFTKFSHKDKMVDHKRIFWTNVGSSKPSNQNCSTVLKHHNGQKKDLEGIRKSILWFHHCVSYYSICNCLPTKYFCKANLSKPANILNDCIWGHSMRAKCL